MNFHDESPLYNHYLLGLNAGIGYLAGGDPWFLLSIHRGRQTRCRSAGRPAFALGANLIARLNQPRGVNPYLLLGAGYMKVADDYTVRLGFARREPGVRLWRRGTGDPAVALRGALRERQRAPHSESGVEAVDLNHPSQVKTSMLYNAGLRFNLGRSASNGADELFSSSRRRNGGGACGPERGDQRDA